MSDEERRDAEEREAERRRLREEEQAAPPPPMQPEADAESLGESHLLERLVELFRRDSVRQRVLGPMGFDAAILITNLITGIIVARALGPDGRGELAATLLITQITAWVFGMGVSEAVAYHQARKPEDAPRLMTTWLLMTGPFMLVGFLVAQLLLPVIFAAQTEEAIDLARIYLLVIPLISLQQIFGGVLLGDHDFHFYNLTRFLYPAAAALIYAAYLLFDAFSVETALVANAVALAIAVLIAARRAIVRHGLGRFDKPLMRSTLTYGIKAHGGSTAALVNARLDLLIMPAFLAAADVGLYSVATNVATIIPTLTGTIALMALPVAARRGGSPRTVLITLQTTVGLALAMAIPLAILAPWLLELVYGEEFGAAADALRMLLPGTVFAAASSTLYAGLLAADKPLLVSVGAGTAAVFTVVGLIAFLPIGGIVAAASVTSFAFGVGLVILLTLYKRTVGISWKHFLRPPAA